MTTAQSPGQVSTAFDQPHPIRPGACLTCGAYPACEKPKGKR